MKQKVAYVYNADHPVHRAYMKTVTEDFFKLGDKLPKDFDVYVFEGTYAIPAKLKSLKRIEKQAKVLTFFADPRLYYLSKKIRFNKRSRKMENLGLLRNLAARKALKKLDGAIGIGSTTEQLFKMFCPGKPSFYVVAPFTEKRKKELEVITPNLESHNMLIIAHGPDYYAKGIDRAIAAFNRVRRVYPEAKLYILGKDWKVGKAWRVPGVYFEGEQDIIPYLKKCSLGIHLGRGEAFGTNVAEMALAGMPVVCSPDMGSKEVMEQVDKSFVIEPTLQNAIAKIKRYFELSKSERKELSLKCKTVGKRYGQREHVKKFKKQFTSLLSKL